MVPCWGRAEQGASRHAFAGPAQAPPARRLRRRRHGRPVAQYHGPLLVSSDAPPAQACGAFCLWEHGHPLDGYADGVHGTPISRWKSLPPFCDPVSIRIGGTRGRRRSRLGGEDQTRRARPGHRSDGRTAGARRRDPAALRGPAGGVGERFWRWAGDAVEPRRAVKSGCGRGRSEGASRRGVPGPPRRLLTHGTSGEGHAAVIKVFPGWWVRHPRCSMLLQMLEQPDGRRRQSCPV